MTNAPSVSVIIPSYRRLERLPALVERYLEQGADEVLVVLDGPHDGWRAALAPVLGAERVRVVELPENRGLALARIAGLEASAGEVVIATDDDVVPQPGFVGRHRSHHAGRTDRVLLGYMPVDLPHPRGRDDAPSFLYAQDYESQVAAWRATDSRLLLSSLWGGTTSLTRELYLRAEHSLPTVRLDYYEDLDLGLRLERLGADPGFDDEARALHQHRKGLDAFLAECVVRGRAAAQLEARWGELPRQLAPLVSIPAGTRPVVARTQRAIAARDAPGLREHGIRLCYRLAGLFRLWRVQDALARLLRRAYVMRGYRLTSASTARSSRP